MKLTVDNYEGVVPYKDCPLCEALLHDLMELNQLLEDKDEAYRKLYIDYEVNHTEYSSERTDPCPDYYGYYRLHNSYDNDTIGIEMTYEDLDINLCTLLNFCECFLKK